MRFLGTGAPNVHVVHRNIRSDSDVERWIAISEDQANGVVGDLCWPLQFAYHSASPTHGSNIVFFAYELTKFFQRCKGDAKS